MQRDRVSMQDVEVMVPRAAQDRRLARGVRQRAGGATRSPSQWRGSPGLARQLLSELSDEVWPRSSAGSPDSRLSRAVAISTTSIITWTRSYQPNTWTHVN